jgi:hypothetical protein
LQFDGDDTGYSVAVLLFGACDNFAPSIGAFGLRFVEKIDNMNRLLGGGLKRSM